MMLLLSFITRAGRVVEPLARPADSDVEILGSIPRLPDRRTAGAKALATHLDPRGRAAIAARAIATKLMNDGACRTTLITSPGAGQGKSTLAANLAIALAQTGRHVLLVDAGDRAPGQREIWSLDDGAGLGDFDGREEMWSCAIQNSDVANLDVLPRSAEAVALDQSICQRVLGLAADHYDHVVIDGPMTSDLEPLWSNACDVTLMIEPGPGAAGDYGVVTASRRIIQRCGSGNGSNPQAA